MEAGDQAASKSGHQYNNTTISGNAFVVQGNVYYGQPTLTAGGYEAHHVENISGPNMSRQPVGSRLIDMLDYDGRLNREHALLSAVRPRPVSFEWLWKSTFVDWLRSTDSIFWVCGHPASGKSTLMLHIGEAQQTRESLRSAHDQEWIVAHHFFDFRAHDGVENNFEGFVRSLLMQLLSSLPQISIDSPELRNLVYVEEQYRKKKVVQTPVTTCQQAILDILQQTGACVLILLDGLDEYFGSKEDLVEFVFDIVFIPRTKICIASRPTAPFPQVFAQVPALHTDKLNLSDPLW